WRTLSGWRWSAIGAVPRHSFICAASRRNGPNESSAERLIRLLGGGQPKPNRCRPTRPTVPTAGPCQATTSPRSFERVPPSDQSTTAKRRAKAIQSGGGKVPRPSLPSDHAFVVQFRERSSRHRLASVGRVEHVRSGEAIHFASPQELLAFTRRVLGRSVGDSA